MRALPQGRVFGRGPFAVLLIAICLLGAARIAMGALVPVKAVAAQFLLERAFERSVALHRPQKPWPWADMAPVARIRLPRLGIDRIVLDTGSGQAMAFGPTLLPGGVKLGEPGVTVIAAHRDTHFRFLRSVRAGDIIEVKSIDGIERRYRVTKSEVVRWNRFAIGREMSANMLALSTCYPFSALGHGPLRFVLYAEPVTPARSPYGRSPA